MKKIIVHIFIATLCLGFVGCTDWLDVNQDPNSLTSSTKELVLIGAQKQIAERQQYANTSLYGTWMGYTTHSGGWSGWNNVKSYNMSASDYNSDFNYPYRYELKSLKYVEEEAQADGSMAYVAICKILNAVSYQRMVDIYGDIPYVESVEGYEGNVTPDYTDAQEIYDDLVVQLDSAVVLLAEAEEKSQTVDSDADIIGGGDLETWKKIANTIKLRVLMRQTEARADYVAANMTFDAAGFVTSSVTANPGYLDNVEDKMNPIYDTFGMTYDGKLTSDNEIYVLNVFLWSLYQKSNDPRMELGWEPGTKTEDYSHALQLGKNEDDLDHHSNGAIRMGPGIYGDVSNGDVMFLSIMETDFLISEALARGYNLTSAGVSGTAKEYWEAGVEASIYYYGERAGEDDDAISELVTKYFDDVMGPAAWDDANKVQSIIYQKYLAMVGINSYESWSDFRRTGFPDPLDPQEVDNSMISYYFNVVREQVPVRMLYPQRELDLNADHVNTAIDKTGVTYNEYFIMDARIFWDAN